MKTIYGIYEGYCGYDGDAQATDFFESSEDAERAVETLIRKGAAARNDNWCCEVQEYTTYASYDEWYESTKKLWGWRTP